MPENVALSTLLFLCTGNYYRSRFAEILFNARAADYALFWRAISRGLALERGSRNVGPIAPSVLLALEDRGIRSGQEMRFPLQVQEQDFRAAHLIIALEEIEHRPLLMERFPHWVEKVEYWQVADTDRMPVTEALAAIERGVNELIKRFRTQH